MKRCPNPACAADDLAVVLQSRKQAFDFRFLNCRACGLAFVDPQPDAQLLDALYPADYAYWLPARAELSPLARIKHRLAAWRHRALVESGPGAALGRGVAVLVESVVRRDASFSLGVPLSLPRSAAILDFGLGAGSFLLTLQANGFRRLWGYDVERNRAGAPRLQQAGIQAFYGAEFSSLPDAFFDCIRLEHVLEHLPGPVDTLRALRGKLRRGGFLVLTVPSIHAWEPLDRLAQSPHLDHLQLPMHLWHHSRRSLRDFVAAAGFDAIRVRQLRPFNYLSACARP
jgi:SAM-dependent methyltransferase